MDITKYHFILGLCAGIIVGLEIGYRAGITGNVYKAVILECSAIILVVSIYTLDFILFIREKRRKGEKIFGNIKFHTLKEFCRCQK